MEPYSLVRRGFTLVEILCVLGIIGLLIAILLPVVASTRRGGQASICLSNIRQLTLATITYTQDYDGSYPAAMIATFTNGHTNHSSVTLWYELLFPYTKSTLFICPARQVSTSFESESYTCGYAINTNLSVTNQSAEKSFFTGKNESVLPIQSQLVTIFDARSGIVASETPDTSIQDVSTYPAPMEHEIATQQLGAIRHEGGANYGFADGHTKWLRPSGIAIECEAIKPCFKP